jgi:hypothetical protein
MAGRKPIGRKAMTPAERQQRRRKRLRKEKAKLLREAEIAAKRAKNETRYGAHVEKMKPIRATQHEEWLRNNPPQPPSSHGPLEELAVQVLHALKIDNYSLDDFQAVLLWRAGRTPRPGHKDSP